MSFCPALPSPRMAAFTAAIVTGPLQVAPLSALVQTSRLYGLTPDWANTRSVPPLLESAHPASRSRLALDSTVQADHCAALLGSLTRWTESVDENAASGLSVEARMIAPSAATQAALRPS